MQLTAVDHLMLQGASGAEQRLPSQRGLLGALSYHYY